MTEIQLEKSYREDAERNLRLARKLGWSDEKIIFQFKQMLRAGVVRQRCFDTMLEMMNA